MKKSAEYSISKADLDYMKMMVESLSKFPKIPPSTKQCASTQKILDRPVHLDKFEQMRPTIWKWGNPDAKTTDELVGVRNIPVDQIVNYEQHRKEFQPQIAKDDPGTSEEAKEKARNAFTYSQPAKLTPLDELKVKKLVKLEELSKPPITEEPPKLSLWQRFKLWWGDTEPMPDGPPHTLQWVRNYGKYFEKEYRGQPWFEAYKRQIEQEDKNAK